MESSYLRCGHCLGFYELALSHCRYCGKDVPVKAADGKPKVFADRATCRALQIAEFEQLPAEAHEDCFRPDPELLDKLCGCLHCGPEGGAFEAVEMRWMANERMWACPCTTCGGRGFTFDIHLIEPLWQCAECRHYYAPPEGDRRASQAKCPKCGCTDASGCFDDESEEGEEDFEEMDLEAEDFEGDVSVGEALADDGEFGPMTAAGLPEELLPWTEEEQKSWQRREPEKMQDDIDFPRESSRPPPGSEDEIKEDDIPW